MTGRWDIMSIGLISAARMRRLSDEKGAVRCAAKEQRIADLPFLALPDAFHDFLYTSFHLSCL
jgi:hypothetical protein